MNMKKFFLALVALIGLCGVAAFATNYTMTQGSGTTFGSIVVGGVNYAQQLICDLTTPSQCASVSAGGAVKVDNSAVTQPVSAASGSFASGSFASGSHASGSFASGAFASGSVASGAMVDLGAQADAACGTDNGSCSLIALQKRGNQNLTTLNTTAGAAVPAGTNVIGKVGIDQTTDGTTNLAAIGAQAGASGATTRMIACDNTVVYDASTSGSTELVALTSGKTIYVCGYSILSGGTVNVKLLYGTGTACATGPNNMTPAYQLTAQVGIVDSSPFFRGLKTAASNALCINASGAVAAQAIVYYAKF